MRSGRLGQSSGVLCWFYLFCWLYVVRLLEVVGGLQRTLLRSASPISDLELHLYLVQNWAPWLGPGSPYVRRHAGICQTNRRIEKCVCCLLSHHRPSMRYQRAADIDP